MKILVVDDDDFIRAVMIKTLKSAGYEIDDSFDGTDAIQKLKTNSYDAVITDIVMPDVSGISVGEYVKTNNLPLAVLAISAHSSHGGMLDFANYFADDTLQKPFTKEELITAVKRLPKGINMDSVLQNL